ncbi:baseplate hub protein [Acinetobacter johnsonii]|uniref:baseplate hub protein n=1 Tax=Acinetobacter johnsonii TaxID=40214 RepID=UPI00103E3891|nr:hypothetical protein [Acinetobacter johnsonii]QBK69597.1 hypothetical protein E0Z08_08680 [Acinetobacter johnsonii]
MSLQWGRLCRLTIQINKDAPEALDLSDFHIYFHISQPTTEAPKAAEIYIYNMSKETMDRLCGSDSQKISSKVILEVGYADSGFEILFKGEVFQYRRGRDNQTDTWLCILAVSGKVVKTETAIGIAIPAGKSVDETKNILLKEYEGAGLQLGHSPTLSDQKFIRGQVLFGSLDANMKQFSKDNDLAYTLSDEEIHMRIVDKYTIEPLHILTPNTGVVGMPQLTTDGLNVTCLLNPKLKWGGRVQVDMTNMQTESYDIAYGQEGVDQPFKNPTLASGINGMFIVCSAEHSGDNRGNDWYTNLVCIAVGGTVPKSGISITAVADK